MSYKSKPKSWFLERVGKRVYRDADGCSCESCKETVENGMIIIDELHADYLYNIDMDFAMGRMFMNYRDDP